MSNVNIVQSLVLKGLVLKEKYDELKDLAKELGYKTFDEKAFDFAIDKEMLILEDLASFTTNTYIDIVVPNSAVSKFKELTNLDIHQIYVESPSDMYSHSKDIFALPLFDYEGELYTQAELEKKFPFETSEITVYYPEEIENDDYEVLDYDCTFGIKELFYYKFTVEKQELCGYIPTEIENEEEIER